MYCQRSCSSRFQPPPLTETAETSVGVEETVLKTFLEVLPGQEREAPFGVFVVRVDQTRSEICWHLGDCPAQGRVEALEQGIDERGLVVAVAGDKVDRQVLVHSLEQMDAAFSTDVAVVFDLEVIESLAQALDGVQIRCRRALFRRRRLIRVADREIAREWVRFCGGTILGGAERPLRNSGRRRRRLVRGRLLTTRRTGRTREGGQKPFHSFETLLERFDIAFRRGTLLRPILPASTLVSRTAYVRPSGS